MADDVPLISLAGAENVGSTVPTQLADAYERVGFCVLVDHGIDAEVSDDVFAASRRFHALSPGDKQALAIGEHHRGFIAIDTSTVVTSSVATVTKPNQSESLIVLHDPSPDDLEAGLLLAGPNRWPADRPDIQQPIEAYRAAMTRLGQRLVPLIARSLGLTDDAFGRAFDRPTTWLRLLRYPPRPADAPDDLFGSAPHTDYGFITLLASPALGGLEVQHPERGWVRVPAVEGGLIMNSGDMLHRWSNGRFRSTPHRVLNDQQGERWSAPFFFDPHVSTIVEPLTVEPGDRPRFEPVRFEDYLSERLRKNYRRAG